MNRKRWWALVCLLLAVTLRAEDGLSVLFIGNSYTYVNDLPQVFSQVVAGAGHASPRVTAYTSGGKTLGWFCTDAGLEQKLAVHCDVAILQEQSLIPAIAEVDPKLRHGLLSAARQLAERIRARNPGARIVFFQTWARASRTWSTKGVDLRTGHSADEMQDRLTRWYAEAANQSRATVAPVGEAWRAILRGQPAIELYENDGSHPAWAGTYLAALVLAKTIYDPALDTKFTGALTAEQAQRLAAAAIATVKAE